MWAHRLRSALELIEATQTHRQKLQGSGCLKDYEILAPFSPIAGDQPEATHDMGGSLQAAATPCSRPPQRQLPFQHVQTCRPVLLHALVCGGRKKVREGSVDLQGGGATDNRVNGDKAQGRLRPAMQPGVPQMWAVSHRASQARWG